MFKSKVSPVIIIASCFIFVIALGFVLLLLPISTKEGANLSVVDALFVSTSSVCVTGLTPVCVADTFTVFGKIVIAILIQIGGLGFVTIAVFVMLLLGMKIGVVDRFLIKEALNQNSVQGVLKLVRSIILTTLVIEFFGFIINIIVFSQYYDLPKTLGVSAFHAISSFNNAGFDIFGPSSLYDFKDNVLLNLNTSLMVILGGVGFIVIQDVIANKRWKKLTIHSKIVLKMTAFLIISGTLIFKLSEGFTNKDFTWMQAFFMSVSCRTAGFSTIDFRLITSLSIFVMYILMFIGASPCSTGGGIKTTTFYTMIKTMTGFSRGQKSLSYGRRISDETKQKALTLIVLALFGIVFTTMLLLGIEKNNTAYEFGIVSVFFEVTSSFGTVGLTMGITPYLYNSSKLILCVLMFFGRLGPLTIFSLLNKNFGRIDTNNVDYIEEKLIIG